MVSDEFKLEPDHNWDRLLRLMESKYSPEIAHARIRSSRNSVSLPNKWNSEDCGDTSTRNSRDVTRTTKTILKVGKDLV